MCPNQFCECPRCGYLAFETLNSYSHCANCLYVEDYWQDFESTLYDAIDAFEDYQEQAGQNEKKIVPVEPSKQFEEKKGADWQQLPGNQLNTWP